MYMARPASNQDKLGTAGITAWANPEVKAVNQFKNKFVGQSEYLSVSGSIAINERGTSGAILVNCGGTNASVNVKANMLSNGTYIDAITGNTFKVSNGYISGNIGSTGIAVITREGDALPSTPSLPTGEATIYFDNSSYNWSSVYAYVYNDATENSAWPGVKMSYDSASGYYKLHLDGTLAYGKVIFAESSTASTNRYPSDGVEGLDIGGKDMLFSKNHTWTEYVPTEEPSEEPSEEPALPTGTATIYFDDSSYKWSTIYAYVYVDSTENAAWPGVLMTYDESTGYYKMDLDGVLAYGKVIFTKSKYATTNRYPADGVEGLDIGGKDMLFSENHTWAKYVPSENSSEEPSSEVNTDGTEYVINTKTKKIHLPSCRYATSANTESYYGDLQALLDQGYALCNTCKPAQSGDSSETPSEDPSEGVTPDGTEFTLNTKTKKIHLSTCRYAKSTSSNITKYYGATKTLIEQGYTLCAKCKPEQTEESSTPPSDSTSENPLIPTNSKYYVEGKLLFGVSEKTTASTLLSAFASNELSVYDSNGNAVSGDDIVGTGYCIRYIKDGKIVDYLEIIIKGDIDGNGVVDSTDYLRVKQEWLNRIISSDVYEIAADIDNNGVIDSTDYLRIKSHFSGTYDLYA